MKLYYDNDKVFLKITIQKHFEHVNVCIRLQ